MPHRIVACLAAAVALLALPATAFAKTAPATPHYYVALGDSLSQGMQPNLAGQTLDTDQGYVDDLYACRQKRIADLHVFKLGCGGDTTTSLLTGRGNDANARQLHCDRAGGSQLTAAVRFLKAHHARGEVPLITIDIGANDVDGCVTAPNLGSCISSGIASINTNPPKILRALHRAAPVGTRFAAMNLYDPVLAGYFAPASDPLHGLALASTALLKTINATIGSDSTGQGFRIADVATAFHTYDTAPVTWEGQQIPDNVATVCSWTWACQTPPSGPNIHANKNGYQVIADAFEQVLGTL